MASARPMRLACWPMTATSTASPTGTGPRPGTAPHPGRLLRQPAATPSVPRRQPAHQPRAAHHGHRTTALRHRRPRLLPPPQSRRDALDDGHPRPQTPTVQRRLRPAYSTTNSDAKRRARQGNRGTALSPARPTRTPASTLRTSHIPDPPPASLEPLVQPWVLIAAGAATVVAAELSNWASDLTLAAFCVLASSSYLGLEIYAGLRPAQSQPFLVRCRTWMDTHTDQVIIAGSLLLGSWLIAKST